MDPPRPARPELALDPIDRERDRALDAQAQLLVLVTVFRNDRAGRQLDDGETRVPTDDDPRLDRLAPDVDGGDVGDVAQIAPETRQTGLLGSQVTGPV